MKKKASFFQKSRIPRNLGEAGLTMIELLVVVAILGILVVVWAQWINPAVQMGKARKAKDEVVANEFLKATLRYYYAHGEYPGITPVEYNPGLEEAVRVSETEMVSTLVEEEELKRSYQNEELFNGEGYQEALVVIDPGNCSCSSEETEYCQNIASLEGPWVCMVPSDEEMEEIVSSGSPDYVEINLEAHNRCRIFDPDGDSQCQMSSNPPNFIENVCWKCQKP